MAEQTPRSLRDELQSLRIERGQTRTRTGPPRWLLAAGLVVLAAAAAGVWRLTQRSPALVEVAYAQRTEPGAARSGPVLTGSGYVVTGEKYISIGVRVPGRIDGYLVDESERVSAGQALVQLDRRDYEAALRRTEASLDLARATLSLRQVETERVRALREREVASQSQLDIKESELRVARA
jgi:multidrug efflux pump subunit AcrA (membrane-fusion protein)